MNTMHRRDFLKLVGCGTAALAMGSQSASAAQRPNIMLIMADDMGYSDIGCYGGEIDTPNLNRLAESGLRFTQFYNTSRCCPTRASLMTGLYPHQAGIGHMMEDKGFPGYTGDLNEHCVTIAQVMKSAGYGTYMSGKWHVTRQVGYWTGDKTLTSKHNWPCQRGFDRFYGIIHGAADYFNPVTLTRDNTPIEPEKEHYYFTDAIADNAVQFIRGHSAQQPMQPFFCYVAFTSPHWPLHAWPEDIAKYKGRYDLGWDALREERLARMVKMGIIEPKWALSARDERVEAWEDAEDKEWQSRRMEVYAAQIDRMDQNIGRIIETLEATGRLENTLIFFLADNGGCAEELGGGNGALHVPEKTRDGEPVVAGNNDHGIMPGPETTYQSYGIPWANVSNTPFRWYKHYVHEGGISTPLIAHWPAAIPKGGGFRKQPGHLIDIMATCVDVSGAAYPERFRDKAITPMQGKSLVPAFEGKPIQRKAIFWEHEGNRAIRQGMWKLVAKGAEGPWELYNLAADRSEIHDLAEAQPERVKAMAATWQAWAKRSKVLPWDEVNKKKVTPASPVRKSRPAKRGDARRQV